MWFVGPLSAGSSVRFSVGFRPSVAGWAEVTGAALAMTPDPNHADNMTVARLLVTS
jgi:hypothetical protein